MTDYTKLKNAELEALLRKRNLPHTGKKAELVARLQEDDQKAGTDAVAPASAPAAKNEDEIDWDDDATAEAPKPAEAAPVQTTSTVSTTTDSAPEATTEQPATDSAAPIDATATETEKVAEGDAPAAPVEEKEPIDYSIGLKEATLDEEIEKRKARAKKFGLVENEPAAAEALQRLERAKKFGEEAGGPRGLNEALPEHSRKRGRGGEEGGTDGRDSKRRGRGGRFGRGGGRGGRGPPRERSNNNNNNNNNNSNNRSNNGGGLSEKDRAAAEARKARFAA